MGLTEVWLALYTDCEEGVDVLAVCPTMEAAKWVCDVESVKRTRYRGRYPWAGHSNAVWWYSDTKGGSYAVDRREVEVWPWS